MAKLSFEVSEDMQSELEKLFTNTAKEVLAEVSKQELNSKDFLSIKEAAEYMGCSVNTIHLWEREYGLKRIQIAGKSFIAKSTLVSFLNSFEG